MAQRQVKQVSVSQVFWLVFCIRITGRISPILVLRGTGELNALKKRRPAPDRLHVAYMPPEQECCLHCKRGQLEDLTNYAGL